MTDLTREEYLQKLIPILRGHEAFTDFSDEDIVRFANAAFFDFFEQGSRIVEQGQPGDDFFVIIDGQIRALDMNYDPPRLLNYHDVGQIIGMRALLNNEVRAATLEVVVDSHLAIYDKTDWDWLIRRQPRLELYFEYMELGFERPIDILVRTVLDENKRSIGYLVNLLKETQLEGTSLTKAQAESLLQLTYKHYYGKDRMLDNDGRDYLPIIQDAGFLGMSLTVAGILWFKQNETDKRVKETLDELARGLNNLAIKNDIYCNLAVRFFGEQGKEWVKQLNEHVPRFEELRRKAEPYLEEWTTSSLEQALQLLDQAIEIPWPSWEVWHQRGLALKRLGRYSEAIPSYHRSIELNEEVLPDINQNDESWMFWSCEDLKSCYEESDTYEDGWVYFDTLVRNERKSKWWIVWHERGFMAWKTGRLKEAIDSYVRAIELHRDPAWTHSSGDLWNCICENKAYMRGVEVFSELTQKFEDYWILPHFKGWIERELGQTKEAVLSYKKAIEVHGLGGWFWSWQDLANIYKDLGDSTNAIGAYLRATQRGRAEEDENVWQAQQGLVSVLTEETEILRKLLNSALSDDELTILCFDHFRPVHEDFARGMGKKEKVQQLLEYCIHQNQIAAIPGLEK